MGKGDKKTKRGKIIKGSYGVLRPRKRKEKIFRNKKEKISEEVKSPEIIAPIENIPKKEPEVIIPEAKAKKEIITRVVKAEKEIKAKVVKVEKEIIAKVVKAEKEIPQE